MYGILPALEATTSPPDAMAANARKRHGGRAVISTLLSLAEAVHHITTEMEVCINKLGETMEIPRSLDGMKMMHQTNS